MTKKLETFTAEKKIFFYQKLQFTYPSASMKDKQATGVAFGPQKRTSSTSKHEFFQFFSAFVCEYCPPRSRSGSAFQMRIQIQPTKINADRNTGNYNAP
jgi:hypothetical protein